ncbi:MAG: type II toxin-antitoxin system RelE/ParE family toxin [Chloroflexota bacterium]|nr:type II toxin-antitoxin system RelE/ParE family toxin [Chloroflexota bacterium]
MGSPRQWRIVVTPRAERDLKGAPPRVQVRVRGAIDALAPGLLQGDVRKLRGRADEWRLRVGDWRVFFTCNPQEHVLYILGVRHRREAYRE